MKDIEELRGLAVIEGKDLATYEYELLKDLYQENQEQQRVLDKIKEEVEYWGYEEKYNDDKIFCKCMKKIYELLEETE